MRSESYNKWLARRKAKVKLDFDLFMKFYPLTLEDLPGELWQVVPNFEDYHASNFGRVKSFKNGMTRILKPRLSSKGYFRFNLRRSGKSKDFSAHQLVAWLFIPNPDNKPQVNHIDGIKFNNHVSNLEWCTNSENRAHAVANNLHCSGEDDPRAKLTNEQARYIRDKIGTRLPDDIRNQIRTEYQKGVKGCGSYALAKKYGVSQPTILNIFHEKECF